MMVSFSFSHSINHAGNSQSFPMVYHADDYNRTACRVCVYSLSKNYENNGADRF